MLCRVLTSVTTKIERFIVRNPTATTSTFVCLLKSVFVLLLVTVLYYSVDWNYQAGQDYHGLYIFIMKSYLH